MELVSVLRVVHIVNAILMAWPFYALVAVNQRARLGPPLGDRVDVYLEKMIKSRVVPCYVFQLTALVSGLWLVYAAGRGFDVLIANWVLGLKFLLLLVIAALLSIVHFNLQPRIDALFAKAGGGKIEEADAARIRAIRSTRKKLSSLCMFCVFVEAMLGAQVIAAFPLWLTGLLAILIAAFTWRAYNSVTPYGWA